MPRTIISQSSDPLTGDAIYAAVRSNDPLDLALLTEDFCFDASVAEGHVSGVLPAIDAAIAASGLRNIAPDDAPLILEQTYAAALGRPGLVTLVPTGAAPLRKSFGCDYTGKPRADINKTGVSLARVCDPTNEGFRSYVFSVWVKLAANPAGTTAILGARTGPQGGLHASNTGIAQIAIPPASAGTLGSLVGGAWAHLAAAYVFDTGADTTAIRGYFNGVAVFNGPGAAPSTYAAASDPVRCSVGGQSGSTSFPGTIARPRRVMLKMGDFTLDPLVVVAAEYTAGLAEIARLGA